MDTKPAGASRTTRRAATAAVILVSRPHEAPDRTRGFEAGAVDFITQPLTCATT